VQLLVPQKCTKNDEEEYALINGELYPRGKKRDINLCTIGCGGMHATAPNMKYSTWGKGLVKEWVGEIPDPEKHNVLGQLFKSSIKHMDVGSTLRLAEPLQKPFPEGIFETPNFPDYEGLPGETEGQKMRAYADKLEKVLKVPVDFPLLLTCGSCMVVCGPTAEESQKRWKKYVKSGFVAYDKNKEPIITNDIYEAIAIREANPWELTQEVARTNLAGWWEQFYTKTGLDWHGMRTKGKYYRRLEQAIAEKGKQEKVKPAIREKTLEDIGANDGIVELKGAD